MNNIIKFRTWMYSQRRMISWDEIRRSKEILFSIVNNESFMSNPVKPLWEPLPFIGVVDSKNREIYLGDICNVRGGATHQGMSEIDITGVVEFSHGGYYLKTSKDVCHSFGIMDYDTIYILGNIYEHPEFYKAWNKTT